MKNEIIYFTKLSSKAAANWLLVFILGTASSIIFFFIDFILLNLKTGANHAGHAGSAGLILVIFSMLLTYPISTLLTLFCIGGLTYFTILANQIGLKVAIKNIVKDKSQTLINPIIDSVSERLPNEFKIADKNISPQILRDKIKTTLEDSSYNKWTKRIILFSLKKIKLEEYTNSTIGMPELLKSKIANSLENQTNPPYKTFWILLCIQWASPLWVWLAPW